jgi:hypothetical protein
MQNHFSPEQLTATFRSALLYCFALCIACVQSEICIVWHAAWKPEYWIWSLQACPAQRAFEAVAYQRLGNQLLPRQGVLMEAFPRQRLAFPQWLASWEIVACWRNPLRRCFLSRRPADYLWERAFRAVRAGWGESQIWDSKMYCILHIVKDRPVLSSERAAHIKNPQWSGSNKNLVISSRWGLDTKPDWPTDRRS